MKRLLVLALTATLTLHAFAQTAPVQLNLGLDHMTLTARQIRERDRLLKPIYDNYQTINLSSVANAVERAYATNIYHHRSRAELTLGNKKGVMENAVRYYMGTESLFDTAEASVIPFRASVQPVRDNSGSSGYGSSKDRELFNTISAKLIEGSERHFNETVDIASPSILATFQSEQETEFMYMRTGTRRAVYSTTTNQLFTAPVMSDFLEAMKQLNLRGLDSTVNFVNGDVSEVTPGPVDRWGNPTRNVVMRLKYKVVYPHFSRLAPIPHPVIFISDSATISDMVELLENHAPRIHAYNKLFNLSVLPSVQDINSVLSRFPNILEEVRKIKGDVSRQNLVNAVQSAFLTMTYGVGAGVVGAAALIAAPVSIYVIAGSPILSPVFITNIIFFL
jgi:hypothetical protein